MAGVDEEAAGVGEAAPFAGAPPAPFDAAVLCEPEPPGAGSPESAFWQPLETAVLCCCRHCSDCWVPVGTLAQTFM